MGTPIPPDHFSHYTPPTLEREVFARIGEQKIRKDAVLCVEILLTASPEFFRPGDRGKAGLWDSQQLEAWKVANHEWLSQRFGGRIVRAELHLDESTPHIHAYLVPLDERGKLNCKSIFGDRKKLSEFQDSYAQAMAPLGLERGIKGSRATHTEVKEYYAAVTKEPEQGLTPGEVEHQLADRQRALRERLEMEQTAKALAKENEQLRQENRELQAWKAQRQELVNQLRELSLVQVAHELGLDPDSKDKRKWRNQTQTFNITGSKFYDFSAMQGGGGAIDLVMYLRGCNFSDAVGWLSERFASASVVETVRQQTELIALEHPQQPFLPPVPDQQKWPAVRQYLTQQRLLPATLVDHCYQQGWIYADEHQNAVFLRRSFEGEPTGATLRGTLGANNDFKGLAAGTRRTQGWFHFTAGGERGAPVQRVVLCESPIDALSYHVLFPPQLRTRYVSTDGVGYVPLEQLQAAPQVLLALDNDEAGVAIKERLQQQLPQADVQVPDYKDWNEQLQQHLRRQLGREQAPRPVRDQEQGWEL